MNITKTITLKKMMDDTLFLAKNLDDFDLLLSNNIIKQSQVISYRSSNKISKKYPDVYVHENKDKLRTLSTSRFFQKELFDNELFNHTTNKKNIWIYRSYEWCDDFSYYGKNVYTIPYSLYILLVNKITQFDRLEKLNNHKIQKHFSNRQKYLKTNYYFKNKTIYYDLKEKYGSFVISSHLSDGGEGVYKISNINDYIYAIENIKFPIIRVEKYLENTVSCNQIAIVLDENLIIKYQPSIQIIKEEKSHLLFYGSTFKISNFVTKKDSRTMTELTHEIGLSLAKEGYRGIFGCDYILSLNNTNKNIFFIEINPRYQASTFLLANSKNKDLFLNPHIAHILSFHDIDKTIYKDFKDKSKYIKIIKDKQDDSYHSYLQLKYSNKIINAINNLSNEYDIRIPEKNIIIEEGAPYAYILTNSIKNSVNPLEKNFDENLSSFF